MIDILEHINAIQRQVSRTGEDVRVLMRRTYQAEVDEVWDALTDPDRMRRWFMPVTGDLKVGGSFQLEGNAGGEILECEPPKRFKVTFGGPTSLLEMRLTARRGHLHRARAGPLGPRRPGGAAARSTSARLGRRHCWAWPSTSPASSRRPTTREQMANSPEVIEYNKASIHAWVAALRTPASHHRGGPLSAAKISCRSPPPDAEL